MKLLLLNTCGAIGSIALADLSRRPAIVAEERMPARAAAEMLVAVVRHTLTQADWRVIELAAVVVVTGPGSFTGVRVGLSAAKGLTEATGAPMIAVSRLAMLAAAGRNIAGGGISGECVCALLDAGRDEFYCGQYVDGVLLRESLLAKRDAIPVARDADVVLACEDAVLHGVAEWVTPMMVEEPTAADALPLALRRIQAGAFEDPVTLDANYLRRTDAEIFAPPIHRRAG